MGRITNTIGPRVGVSLIPRAKFGGGLTREQELLIFNFNRDVENFFLTKRIINYQLLFSGLRIISRNNRVKVVIDLYDGENTLELNLLKRLWRGSGVRPTKKYLLEHFLPNLKKRKRRIKRLRWNFFWVRYIVLRLSLLEMGILNIANRHFTLPVDIGFRFVGNESVSALLVARYFCIKLKHALYMPQLIRPVVGMFKGITQEIPGYRIRYAGRLSRRSRATRSSVRGGSLSFSRLDQRIDYASRTVILKFGKCCVKVWLAKRKDYIDKKDVFYVK